jgi:hypothetical protein
MVLKHPLVLPQAWLDRLGDEEIDALLARQEATVSDSPPLIAGFVMALCAPFVGTVLLPPFASALSAASLMCLWLCIVLVTRHFDRRADAKAVAATGDPATYIHAITKADRLMQEIPPRHRMSTWWLFPAPLQARIAAITLHVPEVPQK